MSLCAARQYIKNDRQIGRESRIIRPRILTRVEQGAANKQHVLNSGQRAPCLLWETGGRLAGGGGRGGSFPTTSSAPRARVETFGATAKGRTDERKCKRVSGRACWAWKSNASKRKRDRNRAAPSDRRKRRQAGRPALNIEEPRGALLPILAGGVAAVVAVVVVDVVLIWFHVASLLVSLHPNCPSRHPQPYCVAAKQLTYQSNWTVMLPRHFLQPLEPLRERWRALPLGTAPRE